MIDQCKIAISYRVDGAGKGAFYDHYSVQKHTNRETIFMHSPRQNIGQLKSYISAQVVHPPYGEMHQDIGKVVPAAEGDLIKTGLLIITGRTREDYDKRPHSFQVREEYEKGLIQKAINMGKPILAICAGAWSVWEVMGGSLQDVNDHAYGGGMPRISDNGSITHNIQIHNTEIEAGSLAYQAMGFPKNNEGNNNKIITSNSIHWKALFFKSASAQPTDYEKNMTVSGKSKKNLNIILKNRQGNLMRPDEDIPEIVESKFGAPIILHQGHPEAYSWTSRQEADKANNALLNYMAKAGNSFFVKQEMLAKLREKFKNDKEQIVPSALLQSN